MIGTWARAASAATPSSVPSPPITQQASTPVRYPVGRVRREVRLYLTFNVRAIAASSCSRA